METVISAWANTAAKQTTSCCKCGANIGERCRTPKGRTKFEIHMERGRDYLKSIGRDEWNRRHSLRL